MNSPIGTPSHYKETKVKSNPREPIITPYEKVEIEDTDKLTVTERGESGFGSTTKPPPKKVHEF